MATRTTAGRRKRASSIKEVIENIETDPTHHLAGPFVDHSTTPSESDVSTPTTSQLNGHHTNGVARRRRQKECPYPQYSKGLWGDITSMNWARVPTSALFLMTIPVVLYFQWQLLSPGATNPFKYMLMIQYPVPGTSDPIMYQKGYGDLAFLAYYVVVFSFLRQALTIYFLRPLAWKLGIKKEAKLDRFAEQGYAIAYFTVSGTLGLWAMYNSPTWYFQGRHYFQDYPYWKITKFMKCYYLLQFSYWLQQFIILVLRLEKPRSDFKELVAHHIVTLWLIGWSYLINLTPIGNAVFITMDVSDVFLAFSKCLNYLQLDTASMFAFSWFICVWTYTRHYLNLCILWNVYNDFDLIPKWAQAWLPESGAWLVPWMKWQIFVPLAIIQALNGFWSVLMWRVLFRAIFKNEIKDERSDDEDDGEPDDEHDKDD